MFSSITPEGNFNLFSYLIRHFPLFDQASLLFAEHSVKFLPPEERKKKKKSKGLGGERDDAVLHLGCNQRR